MARKEDYAMASGQVKTVRVGLIQMRCEADPEANMEKALLHVRQAAAAGAHIVCLQELFRTPYFCQRQDLSTFDLAEPIPGPSTERIATRSAKFTVTKPDTLPCTPMIPVSKPDSRLGTTDRPTQRA